VTLSTSVYWPFEYVTPPAVQVPVEAAAALVDEEDLDVGMEAAKELVWEEWYILVAFEVQEVFVLEVIDKDEELDPMIVAAGEL